MNAAALEGMRYGLLLATAEELVQEQSKANIKIEWFLTKIEVFFDRSSGWRLESTAVLEFLSLKDKINSGRLFLSHLTCYHLMRCRWRGGCPSHDQWLGVTPVVDCRSLQEIQQDRHDGGGVFVTLRSGHGNSLRMFMAPGVARNDMFHWIIFEQGVTGTLLFSWPGWLVAVLMREMPGYL